MSIGLKIDPTGEDANNIVLDLNDGTLFKATETQFPTPDRDVSWASSADTEGALSANLRYQNRTITITCWVFGTTAAVLQTNLGYLEQKIGKINEEGATLEYVSPSGKICIFDLLEGAADFTTDVLMSVNHFTQATLTLTAKPFWRVGEANTETGEGIVETSLPAAIVTNTTVPGDIPALGILNVSDAEGKDQWTLLWGMQSRYYSSSANAELFYQAEGRQPKAGEKKTGPSGASGAGENTIFCGSLIPSYQPIMSTQAAGEAAHLSHIGTYRVFARFQRPTTNTGAVSVALEWADGNFRRSTVNTAKSWQADELEGAWTLVDLGLVRLTKAKEGAQRWEGRILAKSTANGDDIYCDYLMLFPTDEGYGELKTVVSPVSPTTLVAHDEFDQTAGNLDTPKTLPLGGNWAEEVRKEANGFKVNATSHAAERTIKEDVDLHQGSYAIAGTTKRAAVKVQVDVASSVGVTSAAQGFGVFARYEAALNWIKAVLVRDSLGAEYLEVLKKLEGGTPVALGKARIAYWHGFSGVPQTTVALQVSATGYWQAWAYRSGKEPGAPLVSGQDAVLASGEKLAEGLVGMYDAWTSATANTRTYDNFAAFTGTVADAAVYSSSSTKIESNAVRSYFGAEEGLSYFPRRDYRGDYFNPPPSRREARKFRVIVKLSRGNIDTMADPAIDDLVVATKFQARGLVLPES